MQTTDSLIEVNDKSSSCAEQNASAAVRMGRGTRCRIYLWCWLVIWSAWICEEADCLRCYSCQSENELEECLKNEETCSTGETCLNVVYRHEFNGIVYTKGCRNRTVCHSVQSANRDWLCDTKPSECTYCCDDELCNDANRVVTSYYLAVVLILASLCGPRRLDQGESARRSFFR